MSRYIDADELCKSLKETQDRAIEWYVTAKDDEIRHRADATLAILCEVKLRIDEQPTIDVVPVVRCRDCKYCDERTTNKKGFVVCNATHMDCTEDDFCSFGEKVKE